jgi:pyridinium-3,5-biscarboxylic acid mononucleotide synthase
MELKEILEKLAKGEISVRVAEQELRLFSIEYVEENLAKIDPLRELRSGIPEVILAQGKELKDLYKIIIATVSKKRFAVISKVNPEYLEKLRKRFEKENLKVEMGINTILVSYKSHKFPKKNGKVGILCAGTSDIKIAEEAKIMAQAMGSETVIEYDVGIAGIHRTLKGITNMIKSQVHIIIVVAGMEGALGSFVSSVTDIPVIGVPTSIGYGFGSNGVAALTSMLQTCSMGMTVVNIDNGIGAGAFAAMVANKMSTKPKHKVKAHNEDL